MASSPSSGASAIGNLNARFGIWWKVLAGLLTLAVLVLIVLTVTDSSEDDSRTVLRTGEDTKLDGPPATRQSSIGTLEAAGQALFPLSGAGIAELAGEEVRGERVPVQSRAGREGFWVGNSETERVFVATDGAATGGFRADTGDRVEISGTIKEPPADPEATLRLSRADATELNNLGGYIAAEDIKQSN